MVTLLLFSLSTDFLNLKRSHRWGIGEHTVLPFCCAHRWVHTEWSHFMSSAATFQYSAGTESCSAEGNMGFLLPDLPPLLKVSSLWMSCMVTHLLNHIDLHFTSQDHTYSSEIPPQWPHQKHRPTDSVWLLRKSYLNTFPVWLLPCNV